MMVTTTQAAGFRPARWQYPENSVRLLIPQTLVLTKRILTRWGRDVVTVIESLMLPILFLLTINIVVARIAYLATGQIAIYNILPMVALGGGISGSAFVAIDLIRERSDGLLSRLWVLPVHRAAGPLARIVAEAVRIVVTTLVMLVAGMMLGFRFQQGVVASLIWIAIPVVFGMALAVIVTTVALYTADTIVVEAIEVLQVVAIFFSTGILSVDAYPGWVQPIVAHQPVSYAVETMRGLSIGGPVASPMIATLLWLAGIAAVCAIPLAVGYRRASSH
jgi:ABC-2 type transport system permease protein